MLYTKREQHVVDFVKELDMTPEQGERLRMLLNEAYSNGRERERKEVAEKIEDYRNRLAELEDLYLAARDGE